MNRIIPVIAAAVLAMAGPLKAQQNPVVVELFTSQGCSSCPAADEILREIAGRDDIIAIALHVDYWDYIGWKDPFGDPNHAERQRAYARNAGRSSIYTPEMIVNGTTDIVGAKPMALSKAILTHSKLAAKVALKLKRAGDTLRIGAEVLEPGRGPMTVHLLRYTPEQTTHIERGENAGKTIAYANVAEGWTVLGQWDGKEPLELTHEINGDKPVVVIVQSAEAGPILAAARLR
jgi:hypothetical protein